MSIMRCSICNSDTHLRARCSQAGSGEAPQQGYAAVTDGPLAGLIEEQQPAPALHLMAVPADGDEPPPLIEERERDPWEDNDPWGGRRATPPPRQEEQPHVWAQPWEEPEPFADYATERSYTLPGESVTWPSEAGAPTEPDPLEMHGFLAEES